MPDDRRFDADELHTFLETFRKDFEARPLMFGGTLIGVEAAWNVLHEMDAFLAGEVPGDDLRFDAYMSVANKYRCGNCTLSSKVKQEMGEDRAAADELIKRLKEVDAARAAWRARQRAVSVERQGEDA